MSAKCWLRKFAFAIRDPIRSHHPLERGRPDVPHGSAGTQGPAGFRVSPFGIERIAMIRYGITDIRLFYENDVRFLRQF